MDASTKRHETTHTYSETKLSEEGVSEARVFEEDKDHSVDIEQAQQLNSQLMMQVQMVHTSNS